MAYSVSRRLQGPKTFSARSTSARTAEEVSAMGSSAIAVKIASKWRAFISPYVSFPSASILYKISWRVMASMSR